MLGNGAEVVQASYFVYLLVANIGALLAVASVGVKITRQQARIELMVDTMWAHFINNDNRAGDDPGDTDRLRLLRGIR